mmetsp:Transcript_9485/g.18469  ORF Transcript_9485/g.18469 Transcript_9485/m.18469 type:complete len:99 (+) Transcript_9485:1107-1403(+)
MGRSVNRAKRKEEGSDRSCVLKSYIVLFGGLFVHRSTVALQVASVWKSIHRFILRRHFLLSVCLSVGNWSFLEREMEGDAHAFIESLIDPWKNRREVS